VSAANAAAARIAGRLGSTLRWWLPCVLAGLGAAIPVIHSAAKAVQAGWVPAGDDGIIATRGWDVLTAHTPLVGQYSEAGLVIHGQVMHSAGPMLYWLLAIPARYGSVASLAVTMAALNTLAIVGCVALARRRGGLALMFAAALGIALMSQSLPSEGMHDIWNPDAALFGFLLLIFTAWSLACGDYRLLPLAALLASYVTQTHLMYVAPTAVLLAVGVGGLSIRRLAARGARLPRRARAQRASASPAPAAPSRARPARVWPWALAALLVAAACWAPPAIDQIQGSPGNLAMIVRTAEHRDPKLGASVGWHAVVRSIGVRPWWLYVPGSQWQRKYDVLKAPNTLAVDSAIALLAALLLALATAPWTRRFDLAAAALIGLGLCAAAGAQTALNPSSRLLEETLGYTLWWASELGLWVWLVLAWAAWLALAALVRASLRALARTGAGRRARRARLPAWGRPAAALAGSLAAVASVAAVGGAVATTEKPDTHAYDYAAIKATAAAIERAVPPGQRVSFRFGPLDTATQPIEPAIRFLLVRHGDRVFAKGSFDRLGSYYEPDGRPVQWVVDLADPTRHPPRMRRVSLIAFASPWGRETIGAWVRRL
jgi:hypothetical protein